MDLLAVNGSWFTWWFWPLLQFIIGLGLVVFVHEFGHFIVAKWAGIRVDEFALGFGKRLFGVKVGDTDYRVNIVPLGGYVKMLGQEDMNPAADGGGDPRSWQRATVGRRLLVLSAGVAMNVIAATIVFIIVYMVGIRFWSTTVGGVAPESAAGQAQLPAEIAKLMPADKSRGLRAGDEIVAVNGKLVRDFRRLIEMAAVSAPSEKYDFTVRRLIDGKPHDFHVRLEPRKSDAKMGLYEFGLSGSLDPVIADEPAEIGYAGPEHFQTGDRIISVAGKALVPQNPPDLQGILGPSPVPVVVQRGDTQITVLLQPELQWNPPEPAKVEGKDEPAPAPKYDLLSILGMSPRVAVWSVNDRSPAKKAGLKPGDVVVSYGDLANPSLSQFQDATKELVGKDVPIRVLRGEQEQELTVRPKTDKSRAIIGFASMADQNHLVVARVEAGSVAANAGIVPGAVITEVNGQPVSTWGQLYAAIKEAVGPATTRPTTGSASTPASMPGRDITLTWKLGNDTITHSRLGSVRADMLSGTYRYVPRALSEGRQVLLGDEIRGNPIQALRWSTEDVGYFLRNGYVTLARLFQGRVSVEMTSGPVGIGGAAILTARRSSIDLVYFMAMLSVIVAVFNFLPFPVLDGGHVVLVLIEKFRGKPLPIKVVTWIQMGGLIVLGGVFLLVTFNDVLRWFF